jgi:hypothetical protein
MKNQKNGSVLLQHLYNWHHGDEAKKPLPVATKITIHRKSDFSLINDPENDRLKHKTTVLSAR